MLNPRSFLLKCGLGLGLIAMIGVLWWCSIKPSNTRDWADDVAHGVTGEIEDRDVTLHNVRNFEWRTLDDYTPRWETRRYNIDDLNAVDLFLSVWDNPAIAHTLVSFGFKDGRYLTFSVEIRKEKGEAFSSFAGFFKTYEIALIAAEERDIIRLRTNIRKESVSLYRVQLGPAQREALFLSYIERGNALAREPKFYNTITANCTTVVYDMIRMIIPTLPLDYRVMLSGYLPGYIYKIGGFGRDLTLDQIVSAAGISAKALALDPDTDFSAGIRKAGH